MSDYEQVLQNIEDAHARRVAERQRGHTYRARALGLLAQVDHWRRKGRVIASGDDAVQAAVDMLVDCRKGRGIEHARAAELAGLLKRAENMVWDEANDYDDMMLLHSQIEEALARLAAPVDGVVEGNRK